jgi:hypothetical protein
VYYNDFMNTVVQARFDEEAQAALGKLVREKGWTVSKALREGVLSLAGQSERSQPIKIIGLGKYDSGISDLASNKKHLAGLGLSSMPGGKIKRKTRSRGR